MGDSDLFAAYVHHGGEFVHLEGHDVYVGGECESTFNLDPDLFGYFDAAELVQKLGYSSWSKLLYRIPHSQSFRVIKTDTEVMEMLSHLKKGRMVLHLYVEGGKIDNDNDCGAAQEGGKTNDDGGASQSEVRSVADLNGSKSIANEKEGLDDDLNIDWDEFLEDVSIYDAKTQKGKGAVENESECEKEFSEESDYEPSHESDEESESDDDLEDEELASDDEEYIEARKKEKTGENIFDFLDVGGQNGFGFNPVKFPRHAESDYESSDGDVCSDSSDEELEGKRSKKFRSVYDPRSNPATLEIKLGMRFDDGFQMRKVLKDNAIANGMYIKFSKVGKIKCQARCKPPCDWRVYGSLVQKEDIFCIKRYHPKHTCTRKTNNKLVSSNWIAEKYLNSFRVNPNMPIASLAEDIRTRFLTVVPKDRLYRARSLAQDMIRGSIEEHYGLLRRYVAELIRVDRDGKYKLLLGEGAVFKGLYIGFSAMRDGFKKSCRPVIGLDGCFLKTYLGGMLLCAVAKDGNNQMYPISWAVVEVENEECWTWFLEILMDDLAISDGNGWTFISDQQKGLMNAVSKLAPMAEHRNCARHVYMNWKKQHKGSALKNIFWRTVRSTYLAEYKQNLLEMKEENEAAHDDFIARDVQKFCKVFLPFGKFSDMISNNIAETFNGYILHARGMHIIHMCEHIRIDLMVRQVKNLKKMAMVSHDVCPNILKKLEKYREASVAAYVYPNTNEKFEVHLNGEIFVVDMKERTCACRRWQLTGIPCPHACGAAHFKGDHPSAYVHPYYSVERYLQGYKFAIEPLNGEKMWPEAEGSKVKPPVIRKMPGRPKRNRRKDPQEDPKNPHKLKRFGLVMTCQNCFQKGHNSKTCKNEKVAAPAKGKRGRPRKYPEQPPRPQKDKATATSTSQKTLGMPKQRRVRRTSSSSSIVTRDPPTNQGPSTQESRNPAAGN